MINTHQGYTVSSKMNCRLLLRKFESKITKIDILNQKLIVTNDFQQCWVHFEWFYHPFNIWP